MADNKKYKVGITVKEPWADNISYEQLDMTLFAVENGGDGCAYVALKPNIGVRPNQDPTTWIKATQRGQSIYDYCIEYGLFEGTEEEFAQDYADAVQAAKDAAASATHVEEDVSAAEQGRVSAENARVSAESQRASAEESRVSYETQRSVNETGRVNAEDSRVAAENARVVAESQRVSAESTRATNEENRRAEFGGMMRDADTAIGLVDAAMTEAENVDATVDGMIVTITDRHGVSKSVNIGFDIYRTYGSIAAMNADAANVENGKFVMIATLDPTSTENAQLWVRNSNAATSQNPFTFISDLDQASSAAWADWMENQKPIIEADHTTAVADHTQAVSDHTNATNDHAVAGQDHTTAGTDHTQAVSDSTRAGQDHLVAEQDHTRAEGDHTTASTDHSTAQSDHTTAGTDHTTASSDHTIASGDHTNAVGDHTQAVSDHAVVEVYVDSLGVFDLSKHNAVGGVLATYANLDAAITALNALESKYKYGGMSFKFVQSSDHKYVQYFLPKNEWSIDPNDWEKMNLEKEVVKIERYNDILSQSLEYSLGVRSDGYDVIWGYAMDTMHGDIVPSITFSCIKDYFLISDYDSITAKVGGTSVIVGPRFYNSSWKFEGVKQTANSAYFRLNVGSTIQGTVEVFKNDNRIYPLGYNKAAKESDLQAEVTRINDLDSRLDSVEEVINGSTESQVVFGGYISNANIVSSQGWTTVYAKMKPNQTVSLVSQSTDTIRYAIYKEKPVIGDNFDSIVGSMVTGSVSATLPNELPYYYIGFSIQEDISVAGDIYINGELYVSPSMDERVTNIEEMSNMDDPFEKALPKPFYGNLLYEKCPKFVEAMKNKNKDVTVCLTGTSLTQGNLYVSLRPDRLERPPLMQGYDLTSAVFDVLSKLWPGQKYRRFDHPSVTRSQNDWNNSPVNAIWDDSGSSKNGYTSSTVSPNAFIRFTVPSDAWRFNFIYRTDSEGGNCAVSISEGNNKMEVWNGSNWVEANGFTFSMLESAPTATKGNTCFQKRLNMRCKNKASGGINSIGTTKTLTISKGDDSTRFNVVGFEWSPREFMLTVINGARGGHCWGYQTEIGVPQTNDLQQYQDLDLWEFKPDLIMCEVTTINWAAGSERAIAYDPNWFVNLAKRHYFNEFNDCNISLYAKSNAYTDCEVLFYGDTLSVAGTNANVWDSNGKQVFGTVAEAATNGDVDTSNVGRVKTAVENYDAVDAYMLSKGKLFIPVTEKIIEFAQNIYGTYPKAFANSGTTGDTLSFDQTHLNDKGVRLWASFILPLFDLF